MLQLVRFPSPIRTKVSAVTPTWVVALVNRRRAAREQVSPYPTSPPFTSCSVRSAASLSSLVPYILSQPEQLGFLTLERKKKKRKKTYLKRNSANTNLTVLAPTVGGFLSIWCPNVPFQIYCLDVKKKKDTRKLSGEPWTDFWGAGDKGGRNAEQGGVGVCWAPAGQGPLPPHGARRPLRAVGRASGATAPRPLPSWNKSSASSPFLRHGWGWHL